MSKVRKTKVRKKLNKLVLFEHQYHALKRHKHQLIEGTCHTFTTGEVLNRDLTSVGTFDVFVPAHVAPRMSAAMLKESLSRPKYYKLISGNSMLHVSNCHVFLIRRLILLFLVSIY